MAATLCAWELGETLGCDQCLSSNGRAPAIPKCVPSFFPDFLFKSLWKKSPPQISETIVSLELLNSLIVCSPTVMEARRSTHVMS